MRIRTIKPDFWHHEGMAALPAETRLLAIALLNWADDEGYFPAAPALIKGNLFPFTEASPDVPGMFAELCRVGWMQLGTDAEGRKVGRIINFSKHQRVDRPRTSHLRASSTFPTAASLSQTQTVSEDSTTPRAPFAEASSKPRGLLDEASTEEGNGIGSGVGNGTGRGNGMEATAPASTPPAQAPPSAGESMSTSKSMSMSAIWCDGKYPIMEQTLAYAQGAAIIITPGQATAWHESRSDTGWMTSVRGTLTPIADWRANLHSFVRIWNTKDADKKAKEEERQRPQRDRQVKHPRAEHAPDEEQEQEQECHETSSSDIPSLHPPAPPGRAEVTMHERFAHFARMQELDREWEATPHAADELPPSQRPENQLD